VSSGVSDTLRDAFEGIGYKLDRLLVGWQSLLLLERIQLWVGSTFKGYCAQTDWSVVGSRDVAEADQG
jgi:hypothetical protein